MCVCVPSRANRNVTNYMVRFYLCPSAYLAVGHKGSRGRSQARDRRRAFGTPLKPRSSIANNYGFSPKLKLPASGGSKFEFMAESGGSKFEPPESATQPPCDTEEAWHIKTVKNPEPSASQDKCCQLYNCVMKVLVDVTKESSSCIMFLCC